MTNEMVKLLNNCFDSRIRELEALKSISVNKEEIDKEILLVKSVKEAQRLFKILKTS